MSLKPHPPKRRPLTSLSPSLSTTHRLTNPRLKIPGMSRRSANLRAECATTVATVLIVFQRETINSGKGQVEVIARTIPPDV